LKQANGNLQFLLFISSKQKYSKLLFSVSSIFVCVCLHKHVLYIYVHILIVIYIYILLFQTEKGSPHDFP
jgi:hypothetical protein